MMDTEKKDETRTPQDTIASELSGLVLHFYPRHETNDVVVQHRNKYRSIGVGTLRMKPLGGYEFMQSKVYELNSDELRQIADWMDQNA